MHFLWRASICNTFRHFSEKEHYKNLSCNLNVNKYFFRLFFFFQITIKNAFVVSVNIIYNPINVTRIDPKIFGETREHTLSSVI